jgi:hypothetical protein
MCPITGDYREEIDTAMEECNSDKSFQSDATVGMVPDPPSPVLPALEGE